MSDARVGRVVAAAVHESLAAHLPFRMEFYEHWLQPPRLRSGNVGIASFLAVVSFLRQEGEIYTPIVQDAGRLAADWLFADVSRWTRLRWRWLPPDRRVRVALRLAKRLVIESSSGSRGRVRWQRRGGELQLEDSAFCNVRTPVAGPLCGFYAAALERFCHHLDLNVAVAHETCRAMGGACCSMSVSPLDSTPEAKSPVTAPRPS